MNHRRKTLFSLRTLRYLSLIIAIGCIYPRTTQADTVQDHFNAYVAALRNTPGALTALFDLTGVSIPDSGPLTDVQAAFIYSQLFDANGNPTLAYNDPTTAAKDLPPGDAYLQALRQTPGALTGLQDLSGQTFPASGPLSNNQILFLYQQLFNSTGNPTNAFTNPLQSAENVAHADAYLQILRQSGNLAALNALNAQQLPASGTLDQNQMSFLFQQLYNADGTQTLAYSDPNTASTYLQHAYALLQALRQTPGALDALKQLTGHTLPASGPLSYAQILFLFSLMFNADKSFTLAYTDPVAFAKSLLSQAHATHFGALSLLLIAAGVLLASISLWKDSLFSIPKYGWVAIGAALLALALYLALHGSSSNQNLGPGDVAQFQAAPATVLSKGSGLATQIPQNPSGVFSNGSTIQPNSLAISMQLGREAIGNSAPNLAYKPFYLPGGQGPTGLTPNPDAVKATQIQQEGLLLSGKEHNSQIDSQAYFLPAATADKTVTLVNP